jgi:Cd2+/Zn2+-exporting ATPase
VVRLAPVAGVEPAELVRLAASAEQRSTHPVAVAIRQLAEKVRVPLSEPESLHEEPGRGLRARVDGRDILVGNLAWMEENGLTERDFMGESQVPTEGVSLLFAMGDGKALGWIALQDQVRGEAAAAIAELRQLRIRHLALITGDRVQVAERVAGELGIEHFRGGCVPAGKVEYVEEIKRRGFRTVFVGDGVNDAPALAASHVSIAMGAAGSDIAVDSATIALLNSRLNRLPFLVRLARQARLVILGNVVIGGVFIIGGIACSAAGWLSPLLAAIIQVLSTLAVVLNSARLVRQGEEIA